VLREFGWLLTAPDEFLDRRWLVGVTAHGTIFVQLPVKKNDPDPQGAWVSEGERNRNWINVSSILADQRSADEKQAQWDDVFRAIVDCEHRRCGWAVNTSHDGWTWVPKDDVRSFLIGRGHKRADADVIMGKGCGANWTIVNLPFQPEYPGNRQWNLHAAQFAFAPAAEPGAHRHWDTVLRHVGQDYDEALSRLGWARDCGIVTGRDYLLAWVACMFREPFQPLPYLFFYGEKQNSGKSMFHEALALLVTRGVMSAAHALTNSNGFNGELDGAVLAVVEEVDISRSREAYNRLKNWVTSPTLPIRKMFNQVYTQANTLHFVHTANCMSYCPVFSEDTRIGVAYVPALPRGTEIPKAILIERLKEEAPNFLRTILDLPLPPIMGRMRLPVVETSSKLHAIESNTPRFVVAVRDLMHDRDFAELYADDYPADGPKTARSAYSLLQSHAGFLAGITFAKGERTSRGTPLILRRA
jgi:hypothetical protein